MKTIVMGDATGSTIEMIMEVYPRHKTVVNQYVERGDIIGIGPFADRSGNMAIFKTRAAAEQFVTEDPFIVEGVIQSFELKDWDDHML